MPARTRAPALATVSTAADSSDAVIPNFEPPRPPPGRDGSPARPLDSAGRGRRAGELAAATRAMSHQRLRLVAQFDRDPPDRVARGSRSNGGAEIRVGLADALERDPAVRDAGRRAIAHSPRETTFASKPRSQTRATIPVMSLALSENARSQGSGNAARTSVAICSRVAEIRDRTGVPNRRAASLSAGARRSNAPPSSDDEATTSIEHAEDGRDDADHDRAEQCPHERVGGEFGGKPPIVKSILNWSERNATSRSSSGVQDERERPTVSSVIGNESALRIGFMYAVDQGEDQRDGDELPPVVAAAELDLGHDQDRGRPQRRR